MLTDNDIEKLHPMMGVQMKVRRLRDTKIVSKSTWINALILPSCVVSPITQPGDFVSMGNWRQSWVPLFGNYGLGCSIDGIMFVRRRWASLIDHIQWVLRFD